MMASNDQFTSVLRAQSGRRRRRQFCWVKNGCTWQAETTFGGGLGLPKFLVRRPMQFAFTRHSKRGVWKMQSVENAECGKRGVLKKNI